MVLKALLEFNANVEIEVSIYFLLDCLHNSTYYSYAGFFWPKTSSPVC